MFRQDFTCPALLKDAHTLNAYGAVTRYGQPFQTVLLPVHTPLACSAPLATTRGISGDVFFLEVLRCFSSPGLLHHPMDSDGDTPKGVGCPIRISTDQRLLAAPHGFSQRATSFMRLLVPRHPPNALIALEIISDLAIRTHHAQEPSLADALRMASFELSTHNPRP